MVKQTEKYMATVWYSQPKIGYSSYYYYDHGALNHPLVRIRLALDGPVKPYPGIYFVPFARVGFFPYELTPDERKAMDVATDGTLIVPFKNFYRPPDLPYEDTRMAGLYHEPATGRLCYFISEDQKGHHRVPIEGEPVIDAREVYLPPGVTGEHLEDMAKVCLKHGKSIKFHLHNTPGALVSEMNILIQDYD